VRLSDPQRFLREARAIARLNHRNVVQLYDFGLQGAGGFYMVMELVAGRTLAAAIRQGETFDVERIGTIFEQVLEGMAVFHEAGLVHRDLKPENIMLTDTSREKDVVKLLDRCRRGLRR
jgi:serine/threonine-protein kinase